MEKKTSQYFKYAIGEIVLVVIGILIALSINNWNEARKVELKKQELVLNLISDFEENRAKLKPAISHSDSLSYKMNTFFDNAYQSNLKISIDSLKKLSHGFFRPIGFFPIMDSYEGAKASGNLSLLNEKELSKQFIKFQERYNFFKGVQKQGEDSFFGGPIWELRKEIGSLNKLTGRNKRDYDNIDNETYLKLIKTHLVIATFENQDNINRNTNRALKEIDKISIKIIEILNSLKK